MADNGVIGAAWADIGGLDDATLVVSGTGPTVVRWGDGSSTLLTPTGDYDGDGVLDYAFAGHDYAQGVYDILVSERPRGDAPALRMKAFILDESTAAQTVVGGRYDDLVRTGSGGDSIATGLGDDMVRAGAGADTVVAGAGEDDVDGGEGDDVLRGGDDRDVLRGGEGDDLLKGEADHDQLYGGAGADTLDGGSGFNLLLGEDGNDRLTIGTGGGRAEGGAGADLLVGGAGNDVAYGDDPSHPDAQPSDGSDTLNTGAGEDLLYAGGGDDVLSAGDQSDELYGQDGRDSLDGGSGNDWLHGGDGADTLKGGDGEDRLFGWTGQDQLTGGAGADQFHWYYAWESPLGAADVVRDFEVGVDTLDLFQIQTGRVDDTFDFIGQAAFSGEAGQLRFQIAGGRTHVYGDTDGNSAADLHIVLLGEHQLTADDFVL